MGIEMHSVSRSLHVSTEQFAFCSKAPPTQAFMGRGQLSVTWEGKWGLGTYTEASARHEKGESQSCVPALK
jgi:hypothetical protein